MTLQNWAQNRTAIAVPQARPSSAIPVLEQRFLLRLALSPWTWLSAFLVLATLSLLVPMRLPLGGYYWDVALYPDAAWRITNGQIPHVDFFTPVGALEYYPYFLLERIFPDGHILLLSNWSILLVTVPLMALIIRQIQPQDPRLTLGLLLPFLMFSAMPLNTTEVYPLAGFDGFGIYNRHIAQLMYMLVAAILFVKDARTEIAVLAVLILALFFTKITGFVIGMALIGHALLAGALYWRNVVLAATIAAATLLAIDLSTGLVRAYLADVTILLQINKGGLISRLRSPVTTHLDIILPALVLATLLLWIKRNNLASILKTSSIKTMGERLRRISNLDGAWLITITMAALVFESQNSGSQEFIFLWPLFLYIARNWWHERGWLRFSVLALIVVASLPTANAYIQRAIKTVAVGLAYKPLNVPALDKLGMVTGKPELVERAFQMNEHYAATKNAYERLAARNLDSSHLLYSEIDFHLAWLISIQQAVKSIASYESHNRLRLGSIMTLDFVDPVNAILKREPVRLVSIGMMAGRTIPPLDNRRLTAARNADAVLAPRCPVTPTRAYLIDYFAPVLEGRTRVQLTPCWDMFIKPGFQKRKD